MGRGWKILIGVVGAIVVLVLVNAYFAGRETKPAEVTVPGARILELDGGDMQVLDRGPRHDPHPIVLLHCWTCAIDWWDGMFSLLQRSGHRIVAVDLRGFGGSEKPASGYSMEDQAALVAEALRALGVREATVVGHSLGGSVETALGEVSGNLVDRLVIIDQAPDESFSKGIPLTAELTFWPVLGPALWQVTPDFAIKDGLGIAFAPGFDVPDRFIDDFKRMTYTSYTGDGEEGDYSEEVPLDRRIEREGLPLLAIFGAEDQLYDAPEALAAYAEVPGARTVLVPGAGHSPNVEKPARTAALVLGFAPRNAAEVPGARHEVQKAVQNEKPVRPRP
jgi:pimeloyl-ACP methyl ester carboxylesterase